MDSDKLYELFEKAISDNFGEKMRTDESLCKRIWSSLANVEWYYIRPSESRGAVSVGYSFRAAGGLIADIRDLGDYMDWYCASPDSTVDDVFRRAMKKAGFIPDDTPEICDEPGCLRDVVAGWPTSDGGYRCTCYDHCADDRIKPLTIT